jgi:DNA-binding transcriptional regulator YiaG
MMDSKQLNFFRAQRLKDLRKKQLGLTQKDLAEAVGVNLRTLQDWETGRSPMPKPVEILMILMKDIPSVKKHLLRIAA